MKLLLDRRVDVAHLNFGRLFESLNPNSERQEKLIVPEADKPLGPSSLGAEASTSPGDVLRMPEAQLVAPSLPERHPSDASVTGSMTASNVSAARGAVKLKAGRVMSI